MQIQVNEESREVKPGATVADLITQLGLEPRYLAVERNRTLVPRREHSDCVLGEGDRLEIVTLVGGG
ncbi:MAG: thiamine biosynthesis protein ThiS [Planctomycetaceae bacterium]|jgi:thiamine biosynthesis protein ThiS|nr:thiamine biosynthesis protein ThiS [Planctomycetaceae bacterium]MDP7278045.1 sulfur carrier protein ThiS [Planctomycetaceae bacterium]